MSVKTRCDGAVRAMFSASTFDSLRRMVIWLEGSHLGSLAFKVCQWRWHNFSPIMLCMFGRGQEGLVTSSEQGAEMEYNGHMCAAIEIGIAVPNCEPLFVAHVDGPKYLVGFRWKA